jgi:hypothetical protein
MSVEWGKPCSSFLLLPMIFDIIRVSISLFRENDSIQRHKTGFVEKAYAQTIRGGFFMKFSHP